MPRHSQRLNPLPDATSLCTTCRYCGLLIRLSVNGDGETFWSHGTMLRECSPGSNHTATPNGEVLTLLRLYALRQKVVA